MKHPHLLGLVASITVGVLSIPSTIAGEGGAPVTTVVLTASIGDRGIGI